MTSMQPDVVVLTVINTLLRALSKHILCFVALIMTFGLFCWAMWLGTIIGAAISGGFGVGIFLPVLWRTMKKGETDGNH